MLRRTLRSHQPCSTSILENTNNKFPLHSLIPLPLPRHSGVNGQKHHIKPVLLDFVQRSLACLSIAVHIKLEEEWLVCRPGSRDLLDGARCIVRDGLNDPLRRGRTQDVYFPTWVAEAC